MYDGYVGCCSGFVGGMGWFWMVLFWIFIALLIVLLIKLYHKNHNDLRKSDRALDILKKRYAKGEINKKEFDSKRKDLE